MTDLNDVQDTLNKARDAYEEWLTIHATGERTPREMFYFGYLAAYDWR
jgi:hypothetical protein